jgi:hypothetical protein
VPRGRPKNVPPAASDGHQEAIGESEVRWSVQHWEQWTDEVRKSADDWGINIDDTLW